MKTTFKTLTAAALLLALAGCSSSGTSASSAKGSTAGNDVNPHHYEIVPIEAANLPLNLPDLDIAAINGNYALEAKLNETSPAIAIEEFDDETSVRRTNYLAVKEGNENNELVQALAKALTSDEVKKFIEEKYEGSVVSMVG